MNRAVNKPGTSKSKANATNKGSGTSTKRTKTKKNSPRPKESSQHQQQDETSNDSDQHFGLMSAEYHHELGTVYVAVSNHPLYIGEHHKDAYISFLYINVHGLSGVKENPSYGVNKP